MAAGTPTAPTRSRFGPRISAGAGIGPAGFRIVRSVARLVGELFGIAIAGLDALLVGLAIGFVVGAAVNGPAMFLGTSWPMAMVVVGGGALIVVVLGALAGVLVARAIRLLGRALAWALVRVPGTRRAPTGLRRLAAAPFRIVDTLPAPWLGAVATAVGLGTAADQVSVLALFLPAGSMSPYILIFGGALGLIGAATHVVRPAIARPGRVRRGAAAVLASVAVVTGAGGTALLLSPGSTAALVQPDPKLDGLAVVPTPAELPDPGLPGAYQVRAVSYGSGTDARRPEYGRDALVATPTVDASRVLPKLAWGADDARAWFWGFGTDALPLNGLAWLPEGPGPFPLVLVVHGNHAMGDFSEFGYEYLGRHLASRGFITVSVDEDFLNGSWADDYNGQEQIVRAWLLLLHLDQWRAWNADPASPFHGKVDLARVALMGHSRGGEAASVAAMLASRPTAPSSTLVPWPLGLRVRAVVGIAPSDGQYTSLVVLNDTDLLEIHGGHDGDARGWMGLEQFARTLPSEDGFKAALWAYRANHGQFNTVWGRSDFGPYGGAQLNLAPLLDPAAQQDVAKTAIGAFLEASLHDNDGYRGLFQRPMTGREWLPADIYLVRSIDGSMEPLTLTDPMLPADGLAIAVDGFATTRSVTMPMRAIHPSQGTRGVELAWDAGAGVASWTLSGLEGRLAGAGVPELHISLANGTEPDERARVLDPRIELATADGVVVALPLSRWGALPPPLTVQLSKHAVLDALGGIDLSVTSPVEHVLQSYAIPFSEFATANPAFRADRVTSIRVIVDRSAAGAIWLAEVGLADR